MRTIALGVPPLEGGKIAYPTNSTHLTARCKVGKKIGQDRQSAKLI